MYTCRSEYACMKDEKEERERIARAVTKRDIKYKDYDGVQQSERIYLLEIKLSEKLPYLLEDNIGLSKLIHSEKKQKADGYFVVSAENEVEYLLQEKQESNKKDSTVFYIICACGVGIALIVLLICKIKPQGV